MNKSSKLNSFKDPKVWQKSADLSVLIYSVTEKFPKSELYGLSNQMRRAVVSISSNIAEGFKRSHKKEKMQFYGITCGSIAELESQIEIARRLKFMSETEYKNLSLSASEVSKMMGGLMKSLNSKSYILNSVFGFTIVELLVAIGLFSVVVSISVGGFINSLRAQRQIAALISADSNVSIAMEQMAREIRTGSGFSLTTGRLNFINSSGEETGYYLNGDVIEREVGDDSGNTTVQAVTGGKASVQYLNFVFAGRSPPLITISIGVSAAERGVSGGIVRLQTSVSSRNF
jgi:four helix bundle protein